MEKLMQFLEQSNLIEGIVIPSMDQKCEEAHVVGRFLKQESITIDDLKDLAIYFNREVSADSKLNNVERDRVIPYLGSSSHESLTELLVKMENGKGNMETAYQLHLSFMRLSPLHYANSRCGRILLYWMLNGDFGSDDFLTWWYIQTMRNS